MQRNQTLLTLNFNVVGSNSQKMVRGQYFLEVFLLGVKMKMFCVASLSSQQATNFAMALSKGLAG